MRSSSFVRVLVALMVSLGATLAFAPFADAAEVPQLLSVQAADADGRVGDIATVKFSVVNRSKETRSNLSIDLIAASNVELVTYPGQDCTGRNPKQRVTCRAQAYPPGTTNESFTVRIRTANGSDGTVRLFTLSGGAGVSDKYSVKGSPGASPTPSRTTTRRPTGSTLAVPTVTDEETDSPAAAELETEPTTTQASAGEPAGHSAGLWIGGGAILVGLGLIAWLLVMRRRESEEDEQLPVQ